MKRRTFLKQLATALCGAHSAAFAARPAADEDPELRQAFWSHYGRVIDRFSIDPLNPFALRHPAFPRGTRSFQLIDRGATKLFTTEGLSDSVSGDQRFADRNGYELELYMETDEALTSVDGSWAGNLLLELATLAVNHGHLLANLDKHRYLTVQLNMDGVPDDWSLAHPGGNVGIFLGMAQTGMPARVPLTKTYFIPVNAKLMRPAELQYALAGQDRARSDLAARYAGQAVAAHLSNTSRTSVI